MHRRLRSLPILAVLLCLSPVATSASALALQTSAAPDVLRVNWGDFFPDTIDPQQSDHGQQAVSVGLDYEGLTRLDEELRVVPGAAASWAFSPDGKTLTFHLRDGLMFSDGVPVTAENFRYAAERLCSPELHSRSSSNLFDVIGCEELFRSGRNVAAEAAARAQLGVRAVDSRTLEYRFRRPAPYFLVQASDWSAIPLRKELIDAGGPEWWKNPATRIGNGPFRLAAYDDAKPHQRLTYVRNDAYWGGRAKLDALDFFFVDYEDPTAMAGYRNGAFDVNWPGEEMMPAIQADPILSREIVTIPVAGSDYYQFDLNKESFQDKKVREAFAYAFDREAYCQQLNYGVGCTPLLSMIPPGLPGHIDTDAYAFDPEKARQALAASSYGGPEKLPTITWYGIKDDPLSEIDAQWFYQQFRQTLGVELNLVYTSEDEHDALYDSPATSPQFHESTWWSDADPRDWFTIWRCDSTFNDDGYCNPAFDALLDRADAELDPQRRLALYEEAGRMLVDDVPAIFVQQSINTMLVKPYVTGYSRTTPNGEWPGFTNLLTVDVARPA